MFKARIPFAPYLYLQVSEGCEFEVEGALRRRFEGLVKDVEQVTREDLDLVGGRRGRQQVGNA